MVQSTLIIAGVVFVGAAIVGGGLIAFKVEVPIVDSLPRQILLALFGGVLLVAGFFVDDEPDAGPIAVETTTTGIPTSTDQVPTTETTVATTAVSPTTTRVATSTTALISPGLQAPAEDLPEDWVTVGDEAGILSVSVPADWSVAVTEDAVWAAPEVESWRMATNGDGPAAQPGFHVRRFERPVGESAEAVARRYLEEMAVPTQCAFAYTNAELSEGAYFIYRGYTCASGGQHINEVEVGYNPTWVTLESSRFLTIGQEQMLNRIWTSWAVNPG